MTDNNDFIKGNKIVDTLLGILSSILIGLVPAIILTVISVNFGSSPTVQYVLWRFIPLLVVSSVVVFLIRKVIYKHPKSRFLKASAYFVVTVFIVVGVGFSFLNLAQMKVCEKYGGVPAYVGGRALTRGNMKHLCRISSDEYQLLIHNKSDFKLFNFMSGMMPEIVSDPAPHTTF
jgi:uncharacterized membrane protein YeaQ/YmgE (transglycosylase-associated protein family)